MSRWCQCLLLGAWMALTGGATAQPLPRDGDEMDGAALELLVMLPLPAPHFRPDGAYAGDYGEGPGRPARQRLAERLAREHGLQLREAWPMPLAGLDCYVMSLPVGGHRAAVLAALASDRRIAWAQPMQLYEARAAGHDDPLYAAQPAAAQWQLAELHRLATGRGARIAVIDSAIEALHPDLQGQLQQQLNFLAAPPPPNGERHGTAVAGIIAARADNGQGIAGVAPGARLLGLRACRETPVALTRCSSLSLAKALHHAIEQGVDIINLSVVGPPDRLLALLLDRALARGIAVVAALPEAGATADFPASHHGVLAVGMRPPLPAGAVLAPGLDVPSSVPPGQWQLVSGSSFAAAHVSGLLALLHEVGAGTDPFAAALVLGPARQVDGCASLRRQVGLRQGAAVAPPACTAALLSGL